MFRIESRFVNVQINKHYSNDRWNLFVGTVPSRIVLHFI